MIKKLFTNFYTAVLNDNNNIHWFIGVYKCFVGFVMMINCAINVVR